VWAATPRCSVIETRPGITLIGTAHILKSSVREVEETLRALRPQRVLVELDPARLKALQDPEAWQNTDVLKILKERKHHLFLLQLYLAAMQAQMGRETGVSPGSDMLRAVQVAGELGAEVVLIDRDVAITLKRGFGAMGFWARLRLFWKVWMELLTPADPNAPPPDLEQAMKSDAITEMTEQFATFAPRIKTALIDERDEFMASHIREQAALGQAKGEKVVAVVGAGHLKGILRWLDHPEAIPPRERLLAKPPRRFPWGTAISVAVTGLIVWWIVLQVLQEDFEALKQAAVLWIAMHAGLAGLGAILAFGHPAAVATGSLAAPFTSIVPIIKSGWLAGFVQAKVKTPTVRDFQAIKHIDRFAAFWRNGVVRIITVTSLTGLGAGIARYTCLYLIGTGGA
jgi:pheromone shutdown-related protein TraB